MIKQAPLPCDIKELGVDGVNKIWERCKAERCWDKEGKDPGNSSGAQHRKYGSTKKCQKRDPKPAGRLRGI